MRTVMLILLLWATGVHAQEKVTVPVNVQIPILSRVFSYEQNFRARHEGDSLVIGIVYQENNPQSLAVTQEVTNALRSLTKFGGFRFEVVPLDLTNNFELLSLITESHVNILYVSPLKNVKIDNIAGISRSQHLLTMTGVPRYIEAGLSIGMDLLNGKPQLMFNLSVVDDEGFAFGPKILDGAKIVDSWHPVKLALPPSPLLNGSTLASEEVVTAK